jgi:ABC-type polysaccharide/polyol phosphate export permease
MKVNRMNKSFYFRICKELIAVDLTVFKQTFFDKFINLTIWVVLSIVVTAYIMPFFGLAQNFGVFQLGGLLAAVGLFELHGSAIDLVSDFEGDRIINYYLTLPMPSWVVLVSKAAYYFLTYFILSILMFPIGKLCLWNQFDLTQIYYFKFLLILIFQNIFCACFALWVSSLIANMSQLGNVWMRFIFPMWFMGGFQFSWHALHQTLPTLALINLINPMMYITEAVRAAMLGQTGYINFWLCLLAISLFSVICLWAGIRNLKKRLDFV